MGIRFKAFIVRCKVCRAKLSSRTATEINNKICFDCEKAQILAASNRPYGIDINTRIIWIANGLGAKPDDLKTIIGYIKLQSVCTKTDLRQLLGRGIPIINTYAALFSVKESEVMKLAENNRLSYEAIEFCIFKLTNPGGLFYNLG